MKLSFIAVIPLFVLSVAHADAAQPKVMVFDFYLDNTSMEPTSAAETARLKMISGELREALRKSGKYEVSAGKTLPSSSVPQLGKCGDAQLAAAQKAGAKFIACPWVQKVSNLILNLNINIQNVKTGEAVHGGSVDIRGNTDDSWDHGLKFLLEEHVFQKS
ncbi:DUF3280 domain-containing protein [Methylovirgula sp. HY1]|uniref:DUF3280 domain-containing protein n=1 Tax=Methylovirgula sp. HY1 TaxID=2822761 RepID=UPI001C5B86FA|nr:DUF3280 domain-containing protein [Methylovirgula sp. HY1]QXX73382.1 hypothetical protein MHY1_00178 [Methylovirgula sp. HY1]